MSISQSGDGWTVEVDDNIMIWEFLPGMELSAFADDAYPVFENLLEAHDISGMVCDVELDDPFTDEAFKIWERTAQRAADAGIERWAVRADGIKALSLRGKIDIQGLKTMTTEDRTEAVEWTRG
jgi:hypothetical protein